MASTSVLIVVFIFDLIAFALAVAAEQRRSKGKVVPDDATQEYNHCVYDSDIATGFGVGALLFLLASQAIVMMASKCFCCGRGLRPGGARAWTIILFITCWVTFLIAEACLLAGAVRNAYHTSTRYRGIVGGNDYSCESLRKGVFAAGAAFVLFTVIVSELYYVSYSKASDAGGAYGRESAVGMSTY